MGKPIVNKLRKIAKENGYTMSIFRTKSLLHGLPQVRERSFYFFWRGVDKPRVRIEDLIANVSKTASQNDVTNKKIPSRDDPYYRYVLEVMEGKTHSEFQNSLTKSTDAMHWIETHGHNYRQVKQFFEKEGYTKLAGKMDDIQDKLDKGGNIMRRASYVPKDYIGAFVGHLPVSMTHPTEDRYLTYRECMSIMGLPETFNMIDPARNLNHVCQNVPVGTATDMALEIKAVLENKRDTVAANLLYQFNSSKTYRIEDDSPPNTLESFM